jgi:hypothetical protein
MILIIRSLTSDLYSGGQSIAGHSLPDARQFALGWRQKVWKFNEILIRCSDAAVALGVLCSPYLRLICGYACTGNAFLLNDDSLILCITVTHTAGRLGSLEGGFVARIARICLNLRMTAGPSNWPA